MERIVRSQRRCRTYSILKTFSTENDAEEANRVSSALIQPPVNAETTENQRTVIEQQWLKSINITPRNHLKLKRSKRLLSLSMFQKGLMDDSRDCGEDAGRLPGLPCSVSTRWAAGYAAPTRNLK